MCFQQSPEVEGLLRTTVSQHARLGSSVDTWGLVRGGSSPSAAMVCPGGGCCTALPSSDGGVTWHQGLAHYQAEVETTMRS